MEQPEQVTETKPAEPMPVAPPRPNVKKTLIWNVFFLDTQAPTQIVRDVTVLAPDAKIAISRATAVVLAEMPPLKDMTFPEKMFAGKIELAGIVRSAKQIADVP